MNCLGGDGIGPPTLWAGEVLGGEEPCDNGKSLGSSSQAPVKSQAGR